MGALQRQRRSHHQHTNNPLGEQHDNRLARAEPSAAYIGSSLSKRYVLGEALRKHVVIFAFVREWLVDPKPTAKSNALLVSLQSMSPH